MSKMFNPPHPGEIVKDVLIDEAQLSVTQAAIMLGVTRGSLSKLINCRGGLSPEMALRLSIVLNTSIDLWINLQKAYDLWTIEKMRPQLQLKLKNFVIKKQAETPAVVMHKALAKRSYIKKMSANKNRFVAKGKTSKK